MATTAQTFYPDATNWDGTDPASGDVRKLLESLPAVNTTTRVDFGESGTKTITFDPYTSGRTTTGVDSSFGWAINLTGSDGMDSTSDAKRRIPAGAWLFQGNLRASPVASSSAVTAEFYVYRVAASPSTTRTLLFSSSVNAGTITTAATSWTHTTSSQSEITLQAGETIQVTYAATTTGQIGGLQIEFSTGDATAANDLLVTLPSPGVRTLYEETISTIGVGAATVLDGTKTVTGVAHDSTGEPVEAATIKLFNQSTDTRVGTYTTGADGAYTFTRADNDTATYFTLGYSDDTHHGTSDRGLTAT